MDTAELVDDLYVEFADSLGGSLAAYARDLPRALRLAPGANAPWSSVFTHAVTLGAPALFGEAMPSLSIVTVRRATTAHMLAVIEAFCTDRIEDGQLDPTPELHALIDALRRERDRAWRALGQGAKGDSFVDPSAADWVTTRAALTERVLLRSEERVDLRTYESVALAKQSARLVATMTLSRAAGWRPRRRLAVRRTLESIALGLQMHDDVMDWEDDHARGGAWVVALLRSPSEVSDETRGDRLRSRVLRSGVLRTLLRRARWHMGAAAARAHVLGAMRLAAWARERESRLATLADAESRSPGHAPACDGTLGAGDGGARASERRPGSP
jgi:hypothetical protein